MKDEFDDRAESSDESTNLNYKKWKRMDILKFNKIKIREKMCYNSYTHEIVGFENDTHEIDLLMKEMNALYLNFKKSEVEDNTNDNDN